MKVQIYFFFNLKYELHELDNMNYMNKSIQNEQIKSVSYDKK